MNIKKHLISVFVLILIGLVIGWLTRPPIIPLNQPIHAHAYVDIFICGKQWDLPRAEQGMGDMGGEKFRGIPLLHTHDDNTIHLEGVVRNRQQVSLGAFFDAIGVPFDTTKVFNTTNGDLCNGKQGSWKMYVNGKQTNDFRNYIPLNIHDPNKQVISLVFDAAA